MLQAAHRLKGDSNFKRLMQRGRSFHVSVLSLRCVPNNLALSRCGFVVSLRVSKKAVVRNRLKRRLREIVRPLLPDIRKGFDLLIITKPQAVALDFWQLRDQTIMLLRNARLINA